VVVVMVLVRAWTDLAQIIDRWRALVNVVMKLRVSWNGSNCKTTWRPVSFWRRTASYSWW